MGKAVTVTPPLPSRHGCQPDLLRLWRVWRVLHCCDVICCACCHEKQKRNIVFLPEPQEADLKRLWLRGGSDCPEFCLAVGKWVGNCTRGCPLGLVKLLRVVAPLKSMCQDPHPKCSSFSPQQAPCWHSLCLWFFLVPQTMLSYPQEAEVKLHSKASTWHALYFPEYLETVQVVR